MSVTERFKVARVGGRHRGFNPIEHVIELLRTFLDRFQHKQEDETSRVARLLRTGRIVEGRMLDVVSDVTGNITQIFYSYNIGGVEYQSSQTLEPDQQRRITDYPSDAHIAIRYDPLRPGNSIAL